MGKQSGMMLRQQEQRDAALQAGIRIGVQYAIDTLNISLHEHAGWGFTRQMALMDVWRANRAYYAPSLDYRLAESDVYREKLDRGLEQVINGQADLIPYHERYPDLKEVRYDKRR